MALFGKTASLGALAVCFALAASAEEPPVPVPLSIEGKTLYYLRGTFGPMAIAQITFTTPLLHAIDPDDWSPGAAGYAEHFASRCGEHVVQNTVQFAIGAARGEEPRFRRSGRTGFWSRTAFVLSRTVVADMDRGGASIAAGKLASVWVGNTLAASWHPSDPNPWKSGLAGAGISLGGDAAVRMAREYWPEIRKMFGR